MNAGEELYIFKEKCKDLNKFMNKHVHFDTEILFQDVISGNKKIQGNKQQ